MLRGRRGLARCAGNPPHDNVMRGLARMFASFSLGGARPGGEAMRRLAMAIPALLLFAADALAISRYDTNTMSCARVNGSARCRRRGDPAISRAEQSVASALRPLCPRQQLLQSQPARHADVGAVGRQQELSRPQMHQGEQRRRQSLEHRTEKACPGLDPGGIRFSDCSDAQPESGSLIPLTAQSWRMRAAARSGSASRRALSARRKISA